MITYVLLASFPLLLSVIFPGVKENDKKKRKYLFLCGTVLVLFMGLRTKYLGSTDTYNYYNMMQRAILHTSWDSYYNDDGVEKGFQFFVYILSRIFDSPQMLLFVTSLIFVVAALYCIYKNSENVVLSTVMYITLGLMQFEMQGMRQALAMAICMFAFEFVKKKKLIPFALLVILAVQMHRTALVFAIVYFLTLLSYNWWSMLLIAVGSGVVFYFADTIMEFANDIFETEYAYTIDSGGFVATAIYILIVVFAMLFNKGLKNEKRLKNNKNEKIDKTQTYIMYITIIGMLSYIMRYVGVGIAERISYYFMFGQILLLPNTVEKLEAEYRVVINAAIYILCIGLFMYRLNGTEFIPYNFFWAHY